MDATETFDATRIEVRPMTMDDYPQVHALWERIHGFALRSLDDSSEYVARFLERNPQMSCVAVAASEVVGTVLCGHDGRQGSLYHVCVSPDWRKHGIGKRMVRFCLKALADAGISKAVLVAFGSNDVGNRFWGGIGWTRREDFNSYEFLLNEENVTTYVR